MSKVNMTYDDMIESLRAGTCRVDFTKVNGEKREMTCTLNVSQIDEDKMPKGGSVVPAKPNTSVVRAYDLLARDWRSFRVEGVTAFYTGQTNE